MESSFSRLNQLNYGFYLVKITPDWQESENMLKEVGHIYEDWQLLPFLNVKDNMLIEIKRAQKIKLPHYLKLFDLPLTVLNTSIEELTPLEKIKLQMIRQLLQEKGILFLHECAGYLSVQNIQWLLPFCQRIAQSKHLKIILFSSDEQLANTPYIDQVLKV